MIIQWTLVFSGGGDQLFFGGGCLMLPKTKICNFCSKWGSKEVNDVVTGGLKNRVKK